MHAKLSFAPVSALFLAIILGVVAISTARAVDVETEFAYEGTGTTQATIFNDNSGFIDLPDVLGLGKISFGAQVSVDLENHLKPRADVQITAPDGAVVEGETLPVT